LDLDFESSTSGVDHVVLDNNVFGGVANISNSFRYSRRDIFLKNKKNVHNNNTFFQQCFFSSIDRQDRRVRKEFG